MINTVKKQHLTVNMNDEAIASFLAKDLEKTTNSTIKNSIEQTTKEVNEYNKVTKQQTLEMRKHMRETKKDVNDLVFWLKPAMSGAIIVLAIILISLIGIAYASQILENLFNWIGLRDGVTNAYNHLFNTSGWGYVGWFIALMSFVFIEFAVFAIFMYCLYSLTKYAIDRHTDKD